MPTFPSLPDWETHLPQFMVDGTYQLNKLEAAMQYARKGGVAVDVGGHCGLWSMHLTKWYKVVAFEPVPEYRTHYRANVSGDYALMPVALGDERGRCSMECFTEGSSGDSRVIEGNEYDIVPLDEYALVDVDFIKIDCEGYEAKVVKGAENTIKQNRPVIIIEQKYNKEALPILKSFGMVEKQVISGDHIWVWGTSS